MKNKSKYNDTLSNPCKGIIDEIKYGDYGVMIIERGCHYRTFSGETCSGEL
jgi:hypothetical protein